MFLPISVSRFLKINGVRVEPSIELGRLFKNMIKQRKQSGIKYGDLNELLEDAIDKGLEMNENEKIGNCLLAFTAGKFILAILNCNL